MNIALQISFIIGLTFFLGVVIFLLRTKAILLKYALLWIFSILVMLIVSIFPDVIVIISTILGFEVASNSIFSLLLGFIILIILSLTSIVSKQTEKIKTLIQTNALLEKRVRELEEKSK